MHPKPVHKKPTYHAPKPTYKSPKPSYRPRPRGRPRPSPFKLPKLPFLGGPGPRLPKLPSLGGPSLGGGRPHRPSNGHGPSKGHNGIDYGGWKPIGSYKVPKFDLSYS